MSEPTPIPTPPPPATAATPSAVEALAEQLQTGQALAAEATDALAAAQQTAQEIAGDLQTLDAFPPASGAAAEPPSPSLPLAAIDDRAPRASAAPSQELRRLLAIEVPVIVQLGARRMTVAEVMRFAVGAIIEFSKSAEEELELLVNNKAIGKGQAVKVGENFGIKVSSIGSVKEMIRQLGT